MIIDTNTRKHRYMHVRMHTDTKNRDTHVILGLHAGMELHI